MDFQRKLVGIIENICLKKGIEFKKYCDAWVLSVGGRLIYGFHFPLNDAGAALLCDDKAALSEVLARAGVPSVAHHFFMSPTNPHFYAEKGNWVAMRELLYQYGKVVVKRNNGTGGTDVYLATDEKSLEQCVGAVFKSSRALTISPYYDILRECRLIYLKGEILLAFSKERLSVVGDGESSVGELIVKNKVKFDICEARGLTRIPKAGERVVLNWKHNLGLGASAVVFKAEGELEDLALRAGRASNVSFASIDIIETHEGLKVLEINSGIMMENFCSMSEDNYAIAVDIYSRAIDAMISDKKLGIKAD